MKDDANVEPLDTALDAVLNDERSAARAPTGSRERVLRRIDASLGGALALSAAAAGVDAPRRAPGVRKLAKLAPAATFVIGVAVGAVWSPRSRDVAPNVAKSAMPSLVSAPTAPTATTPPAESVGPVQELDESTAPAAPSSARPAIPSARVAPTISTGSKGEEADLTRERALLEAARTALVRRDATTSLTMLRKHVATYEHGRLAEERDALIVQALAIGGRPAEAKASAASFEKRYPQSLFLPSVRAAIREGAQ